MTTDESKPGALQQLSDFECDRLRAMNCSFNEMLRHTYAVGFDAGRQCAPAPARADWNPGAVVIGQPVWWDGNRLWQDEAGTIPAAPVKEPAKAVGNECPWCGPRGFDITVSKEHDGKCRFCGRPIAPPQPAAVTEFSDEAIAAALHEMNAIGETPEDNMRAAIRAALAAGKKV